MKKTLLLLILFLPVLLFSQEEQKLNIGFSGYVGYEMYFDTYNSVTSRDGEVYLYPLRESLDINDDDINKNFQAQMLAIQSRVRMTASGIDAFGAKTQGVIEGDYLGTTQAYTRLFRLRHAYVQLNWEKGELIAGQTWHPMFVTGCFPAVFSFGAAAPFHPLNRAPQLRYTFMPNDNMDIMGAILYHGDFSSTGPAYAQQNSGIPDIQFQFRFHNDQIYTGLTAGYKFLQPRNVTSAGVITTEKVGSYNFQLFAKATISKIIVKVEGVYGQNLTNFVMIGGYGAAENPALVDDYSYKNISTLSFWTEVMSNFDKFNFGFFAGYSSNLKGGGNYYSLNYDRDEEIKYIYRLSPRAEYKSGKVTLTLEHMLTGAVYGDLDTANDKYEFTSTDKATLNHRLMLGVKYNF